MYLVSTLMHLLFDHVFQKTVINLEYLLLLFSIITKRIFKKKQNKNNISLLDQIFPLMVIEVNFLMHVLLLYLIDHYDSLNVMIHLEMMYRIFLMLHNAQLFL